MYHQSQCSKTWDRKCLGPVAQIVGAFGMNPEVRGSKHFPPQKLRHFHKNIRSWIENECCCPRTSGISLANFTYKNLYHLIQRSKTWDRTCLAPIAQMVGAFGINPPEDWGFECPLGRDIFCLRTSTLSQKHLLVSRKWMLLPTHYWHFNC